VSLCQPLTLFNRQLRSYFGVTVRFISNQKLHDATLARRRSNHQTYENIVIQFEEIANKFEITNKQLFSVAGRMFPPDRCRLTDKRFETLMYIDSNKDFEC